MTTTVPFRYGVFLDPPPAMAEVQRRLHALVRQRFGLGCAGAFPPHVTVLGHIPSPASQHQLISATARVTDGCPPITLHCRGLEAHHGTIVHAVGGAPGDPVNPALLTLFRRAVVEFRGLRATAVDDHLGGIVDEDGFVPHLTVAGHDLAEQPELFAEVHAFLDNLVDVDLVGDHVAGVVSLYRFRTDGDRWDRPWWPTLTWERLVSFRLTSTDAS